MGCFVRGGKNGMGCFVRGDKNCLGCFVRGGKLMRDVLSGVAKMAWDVLSRDVLSYILLYIFALKNVEQQQPFIRPITALE